MLETIQYAHPSCDANRRLSCKPLRLKIAGGVYSEDMAISTIFGQLHALHFQPHALPPQGTAPFLVQSSLTTRRPHVRNRALAAPETSTPIGTSPAKKISNCEKLGRNQSWRELWFTR